VNQLVLTGALNDDGAYIRKNAGKSYRTGIELSGGFKVNTFIELSGNLGISINKTDYRQTVNEDSIMLHENTPISFSPPMVAGAQVKVFPVKNLEVNWVLKYVSKQYLDNTGNNNLVLDRYFTNDARIAYLVSGKKIPAMELTLLVNNLFNVLYESNGYVYGNDPYYYPQAGINLLAGLTVRF
jgi:iron complex outermembrane receptor protein